MINASGCAAIIGVRSSKYVAILLFCEIILLATKNILCCACASLIPSTKFSCENSLLRARKLYRGWPA